MMKKIVSLTLAAAMALSLAACGGAPSSTATPASSGGTAGSTASNVVGLETPIRIGSLGMSAVDTPTFRAQRLSLTTAAEAANAELVSVELSEYGDEGFLSAYESIVAQGVDGAIATSFSETVLPLLNDLYVQNNVKYFLANRRISDDSIREMMFNSGLCIGNDHCDETEIAYDLVKYLHEECGVSNLAVIGLQKGDVNGDYRDAGICLLYTSRCV